MGDCHRVGDVVADADGRGTSRFEDREPRIDHVDRDGAVDRRSGRVGRAGRRRQRITRGVRHGIEYPAHYIDHDLVAGVRNSVRYVRHVPEIENHPVQVTVGYIDVGQYRERGRKNVSGAVTDPDDGGADGLHVSGRRAGHIHLEVQVRGHPFGHGDRRPVGGQFADIEVRIGAHELGRPGGSQFRRGQHEGHRGRADQETAEPGVRIAADFACNVDRFAVPLYLRAENGRGVRLDGGLRSQLVADLGRTAQSERRDRDRHDGIQRPVTGGNRSGAGQDDHSTGNHVEISAAVFREDDTVGAGPRCGVVLDRRRDRDRVARIAGARRRARRHNVEIGLDIFHLKAVGRVHRAGDIQRGDVGQQVRVVVGHEIPDPRLHLEDDRVVGRIAVGSVGNISAARGQLEYGLVGIGIAVGIHGRHDRVAARNGCRDGGARRNQRQSSGFDRQRRGADFQLLENAHAVHRIAQRDTFDEGRRDPERDFFADRQIGKRRIALGGAGGGVGGREDDLRDRTRSDTHYVGDGVPVVRALVGVQVRRKRIVSHRGRDGDDVTGLDRVDRGRREGELEELRRLDPVHGRQEVLSAAIIGQRRRSHRSAGKHRSGRIGGQRAERSDVDVIVVAVDGRARGHAVPVDADRVGNQIACIHRQRARRDLDAVVGFADCHVGAVDAARGAARPRPGHRGTARLARGIRRLVADEPCEVDVEIPGSVVRCGVAEVTEVDRVAARRRRGAAGRPEHGGQDRRSRHDTGVERCDHRSRCNAHAERDGQHELRIGQHDFRQRGADEVVGRFADRHIRSARERLAGRQHCEREIRDIRQVVNRHRRRIHGGRERERRGGGRIPDHVGGRGNEVARPDVQVVIRYARRLDRALEPDLGGIGIVEIAVGAVALGDGVRQVDGDWIQQVLREGQVRAEAVSHRQDRAVLQVRRRVVGQAYLVGRSVTLVLDVRDEDHVIGAVGVQQVPRARDRRRHVGSGLHLEIVDQQRRADVNVRVHERDDRRTGRIVTGRLHQVRQEQVRGERLACDDRIHFDFDHLRRRRHHVRHDHGEGIFHTVTRDRRGDRNIRADEEGVVRADPEIAGRIRIRR